MRTTNAHPVITRFPLALFPLALLASCGDAGGPRDPAEDILLNAVTEEVFTVGSVAGDAWDAFGRIGSVAFDADANLHIFDNQADHILVVGPDGSLLRTVGGPGEGPGEFNNVTQTMVARDGSYTVLGFASIDLFAPGGEFVRHIATDPFTLGIIFRAMALPDGRLVTSQISGMGEEEETVDGRPIYVFGPDDSEAETLYTGWQLPAGDDDLIDSESSSGVTVMRFAAGRAYEPRLDYGVLTDGRVAVLDSIGYRIKLIDLDGSVTGTIERPIMPLPVDEALMEAARERYRASTAGLIESGNRTNIPIQIEREGAEGLTFAEEVPVIADIEVDWEDRIWVERRGPTGREDDGPIDIVTPEGDYIGTLPPDGLRTPAAFGPDGLMAFIDRDEFDVPTVRVVRMVALEPAG